MRVLILGATGGVGRHLVEQAHQRGYEVAVTVRRKPPFDLPAHTKVYEGQLFDKGFLETAAQDKDAILCAIGMQRKNPSNPWSASLSPPDLTSKLADRLIEALKPIAVKPRVIAVSAAGVGDSAPQLNWIMRFFLSTTMIGTAYQDLAVMEQKLAASGLEWLAPRPTRLTSQTQGQTVDVVGRFGSLDDISRKAVAQWILSALEHPLWPHPSWATRTPQISRKR